MKLADRIHAHLKTCAEQSDHGCPPFDVALLAFIFAGDDVADIERALRELERDGKAQHSGDEWWLDMPKQAQQKELFA